MEDIHLQELELGCLDDDELDARVAEHLRWCGRCRSSATEFDWLQRTLMGTLSEVAATRSVPRSKWWDVQRRLVAGRRRGVSQRRLSALAGVALTVSLMFLAPSVLSANVAAQQTQPLEAVIARPPLTAVAAATAAATATPPASSGSITPPPALISIPIPTLP